MTDHSSLATWMKLVLVAALAAAAGIGCGEPEPEALAVSEADGSLTLITGTFERRCDDLRSIALDCGRWELVVHVDAAGQDPGSKPLVSPVTWAENLVSDGKPSSRDCLVVGGTFEKGTIDITAADDATVSFTLAGTADGNFDADGSYEAARCP